MWRQPCVSKSKKPVVTPDSPNIDNSNGKSDNAGIHDENDVLKINMGEKIPLNDPKCKHQDIVEDKTEELGIAYTCRDCHLGWIFQ